MSEGGVKEELASPEPETEVTVLRSGKKVERKTASVVEASETEINHENGSEVGPEQDSEEVEDADQVAEQKGPLRAKENGSGSVDIVEDQDAVKTKGKVGGEELQG
jgi:hypothetical protein